MILYHVFDEGSTVWFDVAIVATVLSAAEDDEQKQEQEQVQVQEQEDS